MAERNVKKQWSLQQNTGHLVKLNINTQSANGKFGGFATESDKNGPVVEAKVSGDDITFTIEWAHGPIGVYMGRFDLANRMSGLNFDQTNPQSQSTWVVIDEDFPKPPPPPPPP